MDLKVFFDKVRTDKRLGAGGKLTQTQVDVANMIIAKGRGLLPDALGYVLGTAWGEAKLTPSRENMNYTTPERLMAVWPSRFPTRASAVPYVKQPQKLANFVYNGRLGNRPGTDDGWKYRGGGVDQLTGFVNYQKRGIADRPDTILEPAVAAQSIITGMTLGDYRGPKLADFFNASGADFEGARAIVNADVKANGAKYASYGRAFRDALIAAGYGATPVLAPVFVPDEPVQPANATTAATLIGVLFTVLALAFYMWKG